MDNKTKKFMYRLRERTSERAREMEERIAQRMDSIMSSDTDGKDAAPKKKGPAWIKGRRHNKPIGDPKGRIIDFLVGKTQVKSFNQRGERE